MSYFKVVCSRKFEPTPTAFGFYADPDTEARTRARFDDSITSYLAMAEYWACRLTVQVLYQNRYPGWHVEVEKLTKEEFEQQKEVHVTL